MFKWIGKPITWGGYMFVRLITITVGLIGLTYGLIRFFKLELVVMTFLANVKSKITGKFKK